MASDYSLQCREDDELWSNDSSPITPSDMVWLFEIPLGLSHVPEKVPADITLHIYNTNTLVGHQEVKLPLVTSIQVAMLDLEYWSNVAESASNSNRIARYLEKLRSRLVNELVSENENVVHSCLQPESIRPWAIRVKYGFGHSFHGRKEYTSWCSKNGFSLYHHRDPTTFSKSCDHISLSPRDPDLCEDWPGLFKHFQGRLSKGFAICCPQKGTDLVVQGEKFVCSAGFMLLATHAGQCTISWM
jgi:hypothetical protein